MAVMDICVGIAFFRTSWRNLGRAFDMPGKYSEFNDNIWLYGSKYQDYTYKMTKQSQVSEDHRPLGPHTVAFWESRVKFWRRISMEVLCVRVVSKEKNWMWKVIVENIVYRILETKLNHLQRRTSPSHDIDFRSAQLRSSLNRGWPVSLLDTVFLHRTDTNAGHLLQPY